jgi:hypothetical protein
MRRSTLRSTRCQTRSSSPRFTHDGDFNGLAGADTFCMQRAAAAGLGGQFIALMSDSTDRWCARLGLPRRCAGRRSVRGYARTACRCCPIAPRGTASELDVSVALDATGTDLAFSTLLLGSEEGPAAIGKDFTCADWTIATRRSEPAIASARGTPRSRARRSSTSAHRADCSVWRSSYRAIKVVGG